MYVVRQEFDGYRFNYSIYIERPYTGERNDIKNLDHFVLSGVDRKNALLIAEILNRDARLEKELYS